MVFTTTSLGFSSASRACQSPDTRHNKTNPVQETKRNATSISSLREEMGQKKKKKKRERRGERKGGGGGGYKWKHIDRL